MKILVTGIFGFIGSHFVRQLKRDHSEISIRGVGRNTGPVNLIRLEQMDLPAPLEILYRDISQDCSGLLEGIDVVVNFAAKSIAENVYVPIYSPQRGTKILTFGELWEQAKKMNPPVVKGEDEIIRLRGRQVKALSFRGDGQWSTITAIMRHRYKGIVAKMTQKHGVITATKNHSVYASNLELSRPDENPELLTIQRVNEYKKKYKTATREWMTAIAAYVTEGCCHFNKCNGGYGIIICQNNRDWLLNVAECIKKTWGLSARVTTKKAAGVYRLELCSKKLFRYFVKECGQLSSNKRFPNLIFDLCPQDRELFWALLREGDGTPDGRYGTVSEQLAHQIGLLLALQHERYTVYVGTSKSPGGSVRPMYHFRTEDNVNPGVGVKKLEEIDYDGWMYDLEIGGTHNFACGLGNVVCHNTFVDHSIKDPLPFIASNIIGTYNLLEQARKYKPSLFVQVSTDEVYGSIAEGAYKEDARLNPTNPYASTKACADMLVVSYGNTYGLPYIITRTENNMGRFQHPQKVIPTFVKKALAGEKLPVYGDGKHRRMWLRVEDHCAAIWHLIDHALWAGVPGPYMNNYGIYHVAGEQELENLELAKRILRILGKPEDQIEFIPDHDIRPGHDRRYALDVTRLKATGWKPKWTLDEGIEDAVKWYRDNTWWLK